MQCGVACYSALLPPSQNRCYFSYGTKQIFIQIYNYNVIYFRIERVRFFFLDELLTHKLKRIPKNKLKGRDEVTTRQLT